MALGDTSPCQTAVLTRGDHRMEIAIGSTAVTVRDGGNSRTEEYDNPADALTAFFSSGRGGSTGTSVPKTMNRSPIFFLTYMRVRVSHPFQDGSLKKGDYSLLIREWTAISPAQDLQV
jgi:hypothetical protein